jgi:hypothetical protein
MRLQARLDRPDVAHKATGAVRADLRNGRQKFPRRLPAAILCQLVVSRPEFCLSFVHE